MFYFEHKTPDSIPSWSSSVKFSISSEISSILDESDFPISFSVRKIFNDEELYYTTVGINCWASYPSFDSCYCEARTSKGMLVFREDWDPIKYGCVSDSLFYSWCLKNPGSKGIAIGSNDGSFGDYVIPYLRGIISEMVLVEASERTYSRLEANYSDRENVRTVCSLVTPESGKTTFYESVSGDGLVNSVYPEYASLFGGEQVGIEKYSKGINEMIEEFQKDLDWLHLDVEGLDEKLIKAMDFKIFRPKVIVFEREKDSDSSIDAFLHEKGYDVFGKGTEMNKIAILKKKMNNKILNYGQFISESDSYEFGCAMIEVPFSDWDCISGSIDPEDVYEVEGDRYYGIQDNPHVTILYGLHKEVTVGDIQAAIDEFDGELSVRIDGIGIFENDGFDVVKMNVVPDGGLKRLNGIFSELPNSNEFPEYKPHITIAYVKKGAGAKYVDPSFKREAGRISEICYSMPDGRKEYFEI